MLIKKFDQDQTMSLNLPIVIKILKLERPFAVREIMDKVYCEDFMFPFMIENNFGSFDFYSQIIEFFESKLDIDYRIENGRCLNVAILSDNRNQEVDSFVSNILKDVFNLKTFIKSLDYIALLDNQRSLIEIGVGYLESSEEKAIKLIRVVGDYRKSIQVIKKVSDFIILEQIDRPDEKKIENQKYFHDFSNIFYWNSPRNNIDFRKIEHVINPELRKLLIQRLNSEIFDETFLRHGRLRTEDFVFENIWFDTHFNLNLSSTYHTKDDSTFENDAMIAYLLSQDELGSNNRNISENSSNVDSEKKDYQTDEPSNSENTLVLTSKEELDEKNNLEEKTTDTSETNNSY